MRQVSGSPKAMLPGQHTVLPARFQVSGAVKLLCAALLLVALSAPVFADSKDENLRPLDNTELGAPSAQNGSAETAATSPELEAKYRTELENRLAQERASYEGSLRSLWLSSAAVWAVLLAFIIAQAFAAKKRSAELERLKQQRESGG